MKYLVLYWRMLRYRSAMVLVLFMLLGAAWHGGLNHSSLQLGLGALALVSSYGCATCVNDLADWEIDKINLQGHADRPLITGEATRTDLLLVAAVAAGIALISSWFISLSAVILIGLALLMNLLYSLPPFKLSHRPIVTPFYLPVGYAVIPYCLGAVIIGSHVGAADILFLPALYLLFLARISLKDFRDREGDAKNHKSTFILTYGKQATCLLSSSALIGGSIGLAFALRAEVWLLAGLSLYVGALILTERRLATTLDRVKELISIGFGARIGNGMIFIVLGVLLLQHSRADVAAQVIFYLSITVLYATTFLEFWRNPDSFEFGSQALTAKHHATAKS